MMSEDGSVVAIHLVIESTRVTKIISYHQKDCILKIFYCINL